jgi:hypothetical protein
MNATQSTANGPAIILLVLLSCLSVGTISGCGASADDVLDASALLERYERDRRKHDPLHFSEVDLGEFTVTQHRDPSIYYIRFHLYAVIPDSLVDQFEELRQSHGERVKASVRESVQSCDLDHLDDPALGWLKSEMIASINQVLQAPILRDVAFSEFSLERG